MALDVEKFDDVEKLDTLMANTKGKDDALFRAALHRKIRLLGGNADDPLEVEMQRVIAAREQVIYEVQGKRLKAAHLRRKHGKVGAQATFEYLASSKKAREGYERFVENGMIEYTAEHVVLRYPDRFSEKARTIAAARLAEIGVIVEPQPVTS